MTKKWFLRALVACLSAGLLATVAPTAAQAHGYTQGYLYSQSEVSLPVIYDDGYWGTLSPGHNTFEVTRDRGGVEPDRIKIYPGVCLKVRVENASHTGFGSWAYLGTDRTVWYFPEGKLVDLYSNRCTG